MSNLWSVPIKSLVRVCVLISISRHHNWIAAIVHTSLFTYLHFQVVAHSKYGCENFDWYKTLWTQLMFPRPSTGWQLCNAFLIIWLLRHYHVVKKDSTFHEFSWNFSWNFSNFSSNFTFHETFHEYFITFVFLSTLLLQCIL